MTFFTSKKTKGTAFEKPNYLQLTPGQHTIRILEEDAFGYFQHWINGGGILCLGEECPQCQFNKQILAEVSGDFKKAKDVQGFSPKQERGSVNVLDRTPVKTCPNCGAENTPISMTSNYAAACGECGQMITGVEALPSNKVKLFSRAGSVFEQIAGLKVLDTEGNVLPPTDFDIVLHIVGNATVPVPTNNFEKIKLEDYNLLDKTKVVLELTREEMIKRMSGISIKDIFAARKAGVSVEEVESPVTEEKRAEIISSIDSYFEELTS